MLIMKAKSCMYNPVNTAAVLLTFLFLKLFPIVYKMMKSKNYVILFFHASPS